MHRYHDSNTCCCASPAEHTALSKFVAFGIGCFIAWFALKVLSTAYNLGIEEGKKQALHGKSDKAVTEMVK